MKKLKYKYQITNIFLPTLYLASPGVSFQEYKYKYKYRYKFIYKYRRKYKIK